MINDNEVTFKKHCLAKYNYSTYSISYFCKICVKFQICNRYLN